MNRIRCSRVILLCFVFVSRIALPHLRAQVISFNHQIAAHADPELLFGTASDDNGIYLIGNAYVTAGADTYPEVFLRRLDAEGNEVWTRRFGSLSSPGGVALVGGSVYVTGARSHGRAIWSGFLRKYDATGNEVWTGEFGSPGVSVHSVALTVHPTGVYVSGSSNPGDSGSALNAFVRKFDFEGNEQWSRGYGAGSASTAIIAGTTGVYLAGDILGSTNGFI